MLRSRTISSISLLTLAASAAPVALAQQAASESGVAALQEVVVTAQKREEKLHDVPMGVTAITSDAITKQQLVDFGGPRGQGARPLGPTDRARSDRSPSAVRTWAASARPSRTYIDDVPFGSSNALANGSISAGDFDTWDLQRVEVLRGPQGTLYGAGSEGGLLKYVTNPPDPTQFASAFAGRRTKTSRTARTRAPTRP